MIPVVLLALASVAAIGAAVVRRCLAADARTSDRTVLAVDSVSAGLALAFLIPAAITAYTGGPLDGAALIAGLACTVLAAAATGSSVVRMVLAAGSIPTRADNHDDPGADADVPPLRGGRIIGLLERVGVTVCLLIGWPAGLPVILGVKSLARFSELRAPHASEQFILGTFASVLWACGVSGIGYLLGQ
ncbi:hypothetical protein [Gordonia zhaorongruii]|uniref:hypothetical protein n=1 Tax=Gordonia zhaorongruii TaxID=2597659 RepID=UPI0010511246|nr:hypothetical protein [Gordonia zhaorongruii]